jgi:hypothetical protein
MAVFLERETPFGQQVRAKKQSQGDSHDGQRNCLLPIH